MNLLQIIPMNRVAVLKPVAFALSFSDDSCERRSVSSSRSDPVPLTRMESARATLLYQAEIGVKGRGLDQVFFGSFL
jgi:hypothetical protein